MNFFQLAAKALEKTAESAVGAQALDVSAEDAVLPKPCRAIRIGGTGGDLEVTMASGQKLIIPGTLPGEFLPISVTTVHTTGTAAEGIVAFF